MEMAKVTSKGQITIPVSIRRRLQINEGDKLLFIDRPEGVMMVNPDSLQDGLVEELKKTESAAPVKPVKVKAVQSPPPAEAKPAMLGVPAGITPIDEPPDRAYVNPGKHMQDLDLNSLLSDIRSIGSNIKRN